MSSSIGMKSIRTHKSFILHETAFLEFKKTIVGKFSLYMIKINKCMIIIRHSYTFPIENMRKIKK